MNPNGEFCSICYMSICVCSRDVNPLLETTPVQLPKKAMIITVVRLKTGFAIDHNGKELVRLINQRALFSHLSKKFGLDSEAIHSIQSVLFHDNSVSINLDHVGAA